MRTNSFVDEVLRTMRKDAYRSRWAWCVFIVCTVALTSQISIEPVIQTTCVEGCSSNNSDVMLMRLLLTILSVCLFPALLVNYDSPTRVDAFWRFQPARARAIATGKLLFALPVVPLILSIDQAFGISIIGLPLAPSMYSVSVALYVAASATMFSMLVAALVPDIRAFIFAMLGFGALRVAILSKYLLGDWLTSVYVAVPGMRADVWFALCVMLLLWAYTSRIRMLRTKRLMLCLGICVLAIGWDSGDLAGIRFLNRTNEIADRSLPNLHFSAQMTKAGARIRIVATAPPAGSRFVFVRTEPTVEFPDGAERIQSTATEVIELARNFAPAIQSPAQSDSVAGTYEVGLEDESRRKLSNQPASLSLDGFLVEQRDTSIGELSTAPGSFLANGADRLTVRTFFDDTTTRALGIEQVHIGRAPLFATVAYRYRHRPGNTDPYLGIRYTQRLPDSAFEYFAIYNGARDTLKLGALREGGSVMPLTLPGADVSRPFIRLASRDPQGRTLSVPHWLTPETRIVVRQWKYESYRPVHAVILLPQQLRSKVLR